jgi:Zn-dependent protease
MDTETLGLGLAWYGIFVVSTTMHEAAHAWSALLLGDRTAYEGGQVTLNPLPHMEREPFGMILVPIISYLFTGWIIGWASAPYDPYWAIRYPKRAALMSLAGPAANLVLVLVAAIAIRIGMALDVFHALAPGDLIKFTGVVQGDDGVPLAFSKLLSILFSLNLLLCVFNLLPLPPLDGSGALRMFLSASAATRYFEIMRQPAFSMLGLFVAWKVFPSIFGPIFQIAVEVLSLGH